MSPRCELVNFHAHKQNAKVQAQAFSLRARDTVTLLDMYTRDAVTAITSEVLTRLCGALGHSCRSHTFRPKGTTSEARSFQRFP